MNEKTIDRIIQESVPGKQITIAHVIAAPMPDIYERLGIDGKGALGILTLTPCETAIIAADVAMCRAWRRRFWQSPTPCSGCSILTLWL